MRELMQIYFFEIEPIAYGRMMPVRCGRYTRMVEPQKQRDYQHYISLQTALQSDGKVAPGPLVSQIRFFLSVPHTWSRKKHQLAYDGKLRPTGKPDLDNYIKILLDGMNGHAWADDAQIVQYSDAGKWYVHSEQESPHVEVSVWSLQEYVRVHMCEAR